MKIVYFGWMSVCAMMVTGCLQEDPQMQALRDERDQAQAEVKELKKNLKTAETNSGTDAGKLRQENSDLQKRMGELTSQLERAKKEIVAAKSNEMKIILEKLELAKTLRAGGNSPVIARAKSSSNDSTGNAAAVAGQNVAVKQAAPPNESLANATGVRTPYGTISRNPSTVLNQSQPVTRLPDGRNPSNRAKRTGGYVQSNRHSPFVTTAQPRPAAPTVQPRPAAPAVQPQPAAPVVQPPPSRPRPVGPGLGRISKDISVKW